MKKSIILIIVVFTIIALYYYLYNTLSIKSKRLACQEKTITFEKVFVENHINEAINLFESNNITIKSNIKYSKYMQSHLVNILDTKQTDKILEDVINSYIKNQSSTNEKILIDYYVYENDKDDFRKKNKKAKEYAGYLVFQFKYKNNLVYKIQTDYNDIDGKDIKERMSCVMKSFTSLK